MPSPLSWPTDEPAAVGLNAQALAAAWQHLQAHRSAAFLVTRRSRLVFEAYADDRDPGQTHYTASLAKALVGGLSLALAIDDGLIDPDDPAADYVPAWRGDPQREAITVRHLATHTSGVEDAELSQADRDRASRQNQTVSTDHMSLPGWKGVFWRGTSDQHRIDGEADPFTVSRDSAPMIFPPGTGFHYSNPGMALLSWCVTAALQGTDTPDLRSYLRQRLFEPLGLREGTDYTVGYGKTWEVDGLPLVASWGGAAFAPRATARIGQLLLQQGAWEGRQLIGPDVVARVLADAGMPPDRAARDGGDPVLTTSLGWWSNADGIWPTVPRDAVVGAGAGDQILLIVPSQQLVVVRNGANLEPNADRRGWAARLQHLVQPVMDSFTLRAPVPPSPVIAGVDWDPPGQVRRLALGGRRKDGSDNWPLTWAADGHLYTAYGDGYGFEPQLQDKLSLGYGVISGGPQDFRAWNVRSDGERLGPGRQGEKASGLLSLGGTLYILVRNADHDGHGARLGWSTDSMKTWTWAGWTWERLGHPSFVNVGQDHAGAPDDFVYLLAHDDPSAYVQADRFLLARVPADDLRDPDAYEWFTEVDAEGRPGWSAEFEDRGAILTHPGQCRRASMSYNPGLRRYLLWQQLTPGDDSDTRFSGGFGLYDAPQPWGPWTTAFFTDRWDVGPGDLGHFNAKWISDDGRTAWMVFSGSDNFCVRRARFLLTGDR